MIAVNIGCGNGGFGNIRYVMTMITGTTSIIVIGIPSNTAWWRVCPIGLTRRIITTCAEVRCHEMGQELSLNPKPIMVNHPRTALRRMNRRVDLPWQSTNERSHDAVMSGEVSGRFGMAVCRAKPPYAFHVDLMGRFHAE